MIFNIYVLFFVLFAFYTNANNILYLKDTLIYYSECNDYYIKKVYAIQSKNSHVSFEDYLEYWWDTQESPENLLQRICKKIFNIY